MLLRRRLLMLFLVVVLAVLALGGIARAVVRARDDASERSTAADLTRTEVSRLDGAMVDQETGQRGFLLTGDETFLEPYRDGRAAAQAEVVALERRARGIGALEAPLASVRRAIARWHREAAEPEIALRRSGDTAAVVASVESGVGRDLFDDIRRELAALDVIVADEARTANNDRVDSRRVVTATVAAIIVVAFTATIVAGWFIRRWVTRPIGSLVDDVRRVREGDLDAPIRSNGPPEIAELATAIDSMRSRINSSRILAERAREAIEQNASVVLALRSQLEPEVGELPRGWTMAAQLRAAEGVAAGDCYDIARLTRDRIALVVVDIAGHGAAEGLLALRCKELLRALLAADVAPGDAVLAAATQLGDMGEEVFLTTFVAVIDTASGRIRFANAGHPPAFVCSALGDIELAPTGPLVGLLSGTWSTGTADIAPGDALCAFTDGLIEVRNTEREFFGPERLLDLVRGSRCEEASLIVKRVLDEVELFAPGRLHDDATVVVMCRPDDAAPETSG